MMVDFAILAKFGPTFSLGALTSPSLRPPSLTTYLVSTLMTMAESNSGLAACVVGAADPTAFTKCEFEAARWVVWGCGLPS